MYKFNGLTDKQWDLLKPYLPPKPSKTWIGRRPQNFRPILNTIFLVLITGSRWKDVPSKPNFAKRSTAHFWLGRWQKDGTFDKILKMLIKKANDFKIIDISRIGVDGFFSQR